eukprot:COSAG06_NODE_2361_length_7004_cov_49.479218_2_plen_58_part_00
MKNAVTVAATAALAIAAAAAAPVVRASIIAHRRAREGRLASLLLHRVLGSSVPDSKH